MNLTDLRDELDARSTPADDLLGSVRLAGVQTRIQAIRRRRVAGVAAAFAVVAAVFIGYATMPRTSALPEPATTPSPATVNGFAEYAIGAKVVATGTASMHDSISLTAVAGERGFTFTQRCAVYDEKLFVKLRINGHDIGGSSCSPGGGSFYTMADETWDDLGVRPGDRVTITARLEGARSPATVIPDGDFSVAVMARVAVEDYPFPPRPAVLQPLSEAAGNVWPEHSIAVVESDPVDPNATRIVTVTLPKGAELSLDMVAQTPGSLRVLVNGKHLQDAEWWTYDLGIVAATLSGDRTVTLTFQPERMTGAWRAVIHR